MKDDIRLYASIDVMRDTVPIRFAHHKSTDKPENHVLHINNHVEIYIFVSGDHSYMVESSIYKLKRGDIVIINPREVHKALPMSETFYERFYFLVDEHTFDAMNQNPLSQVLNKPHHACDLISPDEEAREEILRMLYEISDCFREGRNDRMRAFGFFLRILDEINQRLGREYSQASDVARTPALLESILTYVAEHIGELQSTTEISTALGLSPQYLSSYFSKHIGTPLKTYIQAKRIALAKDLLDKGADVTNACYECGFNDCSYFIRIFKKYVGMTPLSYKQRIEG